jgi:hypothetical protein
MEEEIVSTSTARINLSDYITPTSNTLYDYFTTSSTNITPLTTGGTERMRVASNGTITIGTASLPQHRLIIGGQKSFKFLRGYEV